MNSNIIVNSKQAAYILGMSMETFCYHRRAIRNGKPNKTRIMHIPKKNPNNKQEECKYYFDTLVDWYIIKNLKNPIMKSESISDVSFADMYKSVYNNLMERKKEYDKLYISTFTLNDIDPNNITFETFISVRKYLGYNQKEFAEMLTRKGMKEYNSDMIIRLEKGQQTITYADVLSMLAVAGKRLALAGNK